MVGPLGRSDVWFLTALVIFLIGADHQNIVFITAVATGLTVAAAALPLQPGLATRLLDTRALAVLGVASYSLYLWHYPIVLHLSRHIGNYVLLLCASLLICIPVAFASYRSVELPFLRLRRRWTTSTSGSVPQRHPPGRSPGGSHPDPTAVGEAG
jgi:peptidoglycan/LPS O-acetylase OafA/YrhL